MYFCIHFKIVFFYGQNEKKTLKCIQKYKGPRIAKTILKNKNKVGGLIEKIFANYMTNKGVNIQHYKQLIQLNIKKQKTQFKNGQKN